MLPDVILLELFECYLQAYRDIYISIYYAEEWPTLVHVCRKWRGVIFGSPRRLNLQLHYNSRSPVGELLSIWPPLPIVLWGTKLDEDNIIAVLEHNDRMGQITLEYEPRSRLENFVVSMREPFPALTGLHMSSSFHKAARGLCDSFLGGSAPRLQFLHLLGIPFPGLPKLLLSATHLVTLYLWYIPHSGYISPEAMVTSLSVLTRLENLKLSFQSSRSRPNRESRRPHPPTRSVLPSLTFLHFMGVSEYLEDLMARINAPQLDDLHIIFFHQLIFDTPLLAQFISRIPKLTAHDQAHVAFSDWGAFLTLPRTYDKQFQLAISCTQPDWHVLSMAQVCNSTLPPFSTLEHLYISDRGSTQRRWHGDIENSEWLELLRPFAAVKNLYLAEEYAPHIVPALKEVVRERETEVLPALECLFLEKLYESGPVQVAIRQLVAMRQLSNRSIAVSLWERGIRDW